ncbi:MAG: NAD(P)H-dependent oxidoreductase [Pseudomonadota bacterium]
MPQMKLLGISGSLRKASDNRKLIREAARLAEASEFLEADLKLPLYDGDLEDADGIPESVLVLARQIADAQAVVISTPEYNKGVSGVLKNALDWLSRTDIKPWAGKPVAILSATAGRSGGERVQANLRLLMMPFRPRLVIGPDVLVGGSYDQFDKDDRLVGEIYIKQLTELMQATQAEIDRAQ